MSRKHTNGHNKVAAVVTGALLAAGAFLGKALAKVIFRYRWQLTPLLVAGPLPLLAWLLALTYWLWPTWTLGGFGIGGVCAAVWVWQGLHRLYDRILGGLVAGLALAWLLAVAVNPGTIALYGALALTWPVLGLFWWCGGAFRSGRALSQLRKRWSTIAELAGVVGAKLVRAEDTEVGQVLTVELPGDKVQSDLSKARLEAAMRTRPGAIHLVNDDKNARRVTVHHVAVDPWADGSEITHPLMAVVTALNAASTDTNLEEAA
jgi:hypothetical protein